MKKILRITFCSLLLAAAVVALKLSLTPLLMKNANYGVNPLKQKGGADVLFVGSSMFRQGIAVQDMGPDTYLLVYNGFQPFSEYLLLEELLEDDIRIDTLVVDMYAYSAVGRPSLEDTRLWQGMPLSFILSLFSETRAGGGADLLDLYDMVVKANNEIFFSWPVSFPLINARYDRGGNLGKTAGATAEILDSCDIGYPDAAGMDPAQLSSLEKLLDLCREHDVGVVFVETPKYQRMYRETTYCDIMREYLAFTHRNGVRTILSEQTAAACSTLDRSLDISYAFDSGNASFFTDLIHLSYDGRCAFTGILQKLL